MKKFKIIAGPCSVESKPQMQEILSMKYSPPLIRGGTYKMRTQKSSFQGLGAEALSIIKELKKEKDFSFVSEITDPRQIESFQGIVDVFQVGARNMYNYELLKELAHLGKPVILKRSFSATLSEWLGSADYLHPLGNDKTILCERGVRSFDSKLRNMLDLGSVIWLKKETPFPVIVDPSHAMGMSKYVADAAMASMAAGADGIMVEVHPEPTRALSDKEQALSLFQYEQLIVELQKLGGALNLEVEL
jgi:3-deoxy-7-phosphoheptulonate synthase